MESSFSNNASSSLLAKSSLGLVCKGSYRAMVAPRITGSRGRTQRAVAAPFEGEFVDVSIRKTRCVDDARDPGAAQFCREFVTRFGHRVRFLRNPRCCMRPVDNIYIRYEKSSSFNLVRMDRNDFHPSGHSKKSSFDRNASSVARCRSGFLRTFRNPNQSSATGSGRSRSNVGPAATRFSNLTDIYLAARSGTPK